MFGLVKNRGVIPNLKNKKGTANALRFQSRLF